ncbi:type 2 periplasmic-binding domain-containing protein [Gallaecimonas mangrovi]|uniref:hypothetical protein n=1 Tax=Gallaecimonas mangrovi TaxID=2291597 RepID=UPI000E206552|nr:hypothetical protein [Gallaecimonas mangrovi]
MSQKTKQNTQKRSDFSIDNQCYLVSTVSKGLTVIKENSRWGLGWPLYKLQTIQAIKGHVDRQPYPNPAILECLGLNTDSLLIALGQHQLSKGTVIGHIQAQSAYAKAHHRRPADKSSLIPSQHHTHKPSAIAESLARL